MSNRQIHWITDGVHSELSNNGNQSDRPSSRRCDVDMTALGEAASVLAHSSIGSTVALTKRAHLVQLQRCCDIPSLDRSQPK